MSQGQFRLEFKRPFYVTFQQQSRFAYRYLVIWAARIEDAQKITRDALDFNEWSMIYTRVEFGNQIDEWNLTRVTLDELLET